MYLYLKGDGERIALSGIDLKDGCLPSIDGQGPGVSDKDGTPVRLEPAVWFKVLVLDNVCIDCNRRIVKWGTDELSGSCSSSVIEDTLTSDDVERRVSTYRTSLFLGGECYDYSSNPDELFDKAKLAIINNNKRKITRSELHNIVIQLLHTHILPAVKLRTDDLEKVEEALEIQCNYIAEADEKITKLDGKIQIDEKTLKNLREKLIVGYQNGEIDVTKCPEMVMVKLKTSLVKDVCKTRDDLDSCQADVDMIKAQMTCKNTIPDSTVSQLSEKREIRNNVQDVYENLIMSRENLKVASEEMKRKVSFLTNCLSKLTKGSQPSQMRYDQFHKIYLGIEEKILERKKDMHELMENKLLMMSVREALQATIKELKEGEPTEGIDIHKSRSRRSTDVLRHSSLPLEWLTLSEKVAAFVTNEQSDIGKCHQTFCDMLKGKCIALDEPYGLWRSSLTCNASLEKAELWMMEKQLAFNDPKPDMRESDLAHEAYDNLVEKTPISGDDHDYVFVYDNARNPLQESMMKLRCEINDHFKEITNMILNELKSSNAKSNIEKVWLCYESHFYEIAGPLLNIVYQKIYFDTSRNLKKEVPLLTLEELDIKEPWILELLSRDPILRDSGFQGSGDGSPIDSPNSPILPRKVSYDTMSLRSINIEDINLESKAYDLMVPFEKAILEDGRQKTMENLECNSTVEGVTKKIPIGKFRTEINVKLNKLRPYKDLSYLPGKRNVATSQSNIVGVVRIRPKSTRCKGIKRTGKLYDASDETEMIDFSGSATTDVHALDLAIHNTKTTSFQNDEIQNDEIEKNKIHHEQSVSKSKKVDISQITFTEIFKDAFDCLDDFLREAVPLQQLQILTRCVRSICSGLSRLQSSNSVSCSDTLNDFVVLLLMHYEPDKVGQLYPRLESLIGAMPAFLHGGAHDFAMVTFTLVFQYIFQVLIKKANSKNCTFC
ncbi:unnamed protein product [Owenia fusiformis]|uniref:Uncharacterized protein n=1 Tax=Owenia fusiformis TaxID=6347 RepID=A0A8S4P8H9_OWEFU|nr:unnamed protein product [Owenia fusiformis]